MDRLFSADRFLVALSYDGVSSLLLREKQVKGRCHCGSVRYEVQGVPITHALCHCDDCKRCSGAPLVGWAMFPETAFLLLSGTTTTYASSENGRREFCPTCGSGLFYRNGVTLPGIVDIQTATLDDPSALPARCHVQTAERIPWMKTLHSLPEFERYPAGK